MQYVFLVVFPSLQGMRTCVSGWRHCPTSLPSTFSFFAVSVRLVYRIFSFVFVKYSSQTVAFYVWHLCAQAPCDAWISRPISYPSNQDGSQEHIFLIIIIFFCLIILHLLYISSANSSRILGFNFVCLYFTTGYFWRVGLLYKKCLCLFFTLILGSVFADYVVRKGYIVSWIFVISSMNCSIELVSYVLSRNFVVVKETAIESA